MIELRFVVKKCQWGEWDFMGHTVLFWHSRMELHLFFSFLFIGKWTDSIWQCLKWRPINSRIRVYKNLIAKIHTGLRFLFQKIWGTQPLALCEFTVIPLSQNTGWFKANLYTLTNDYDKYSVYTDNNHGRFILSLYGNSIW